jgi:hypothetical protein
MKHAALICTAGLALAAVIALPAEAKKKPPADPGAQVCELAWKASFGTIELKQNFTGAGQLEREEISIRRTIPASGNRAGTLTMSGWTNSGGSSTYTSRQYYLGLSGPGGGKGQRLIIAMPEGQQLKIVMEYGAIMIPLSEAELARLLSARQRLSYKMVKLVGSEEQQIGEGWFDLSGLADLPMAGMPDALKRSQAAMDKARAGPEVPCASAYAVEMNSMDSDEPVRKWLTFDCSENWAVPLGEFTLSTDSYSWRPAPRDEIRLLFTANHWLNPRADQQQFLTDPLDPNRFGRLDVMFDQRDWGLNYRSTVPAERERQSGEVKRGKFVGRKWLGQNGSTGLFWSEFAQMLAGEGDLQITAFDTISGKVVRGTLPWSEVTAAEDELRKGQARLIERERDPFNQCKAKVDAEFGQEDIIVT